jgi:hypothetical protein
MQCRTRIYLMFNVIDLLHKRLYCILWTDKLVGKCGIMKMGICFQVMSAKYNGNPYDNSFCCCTLPCLEWDSVRMFNLAVVCQTNITVDR